MNEKRWIVFIVSLLLLSLSGCRTRAGVYGNRDRAYRVREDIAELSDKQAGSAISSERLSGAIEGAREQSENLSGELTASREQSERFTQSITDGAGYLEEFASILQRIRKRGSKTDSGDANGDR